MKDYPRTSLDGVLTFNHLNVIRDKTHVFLNFQTRVSCLFQNEIAGPLRTDEKWNCNAFEITFLNHFGFHVRFCSMARDVGETSHESVSLPKDKDHFFVP